MLPVAIGVAVCAAAPQARASFMLDFELDQDGVAPPNGRSLVDVDVFGELVVFHTLISISSLSAPNPVGWPAHKGPAIFDSTPGGPNDPGPDPDLLVDLGNVLMLQCRNTGSGDGCPSSHSQQSQAGIFDVPNDEAGGGTIVFDFLEAARLLSIDLIDVDDNGPVTVRMIDGSSLQRTYRVPRDWTFDVSADGPNGYGTLDLVSLASQLGEAGGTATASEDAGFDAFDVWRLEVAFEGSGALDNLKGELVTLAEPSTSLLMALAMAALALVRRRARVTERRV